MSEKNKPPNYATLNDNDPHFTVVGRVASAWAVIEALMDGAIAHLANADDAAMACVTSQLIGPAKRMDALIALFTLRKGSAALRTRLKSFQGKIQQIGEDRNRVVHDPLFIKKSTGQAHKALITAKGELKYEFVAVDIEDMKKTVKKIQDAGHEFIRLKNEIKVELNDIKQAELGNILAIPGDRNPQGGNS